MATDDKKPAPDDMSEGYNFAQDDASAKATNGGGGLSGGAPAVSAAAGIGFVLYSLFSGDAPPEHPTKKEPEPVAPPSPEAQLPFDLPNNPAPPLPDPSLITPEVTPPPPPPPPPPPMCPDGSPPPCVDIDANKPTNEALQARIKSPMLVTDGQATGQASAQQAQAQQALSANDPNAAFANNVINATEAEQVEAGTIGNLRFMIAQGKVIQAVLETAINSDLPGSIRAIVSRDIYAEAGNAVLIPKGSRLIGTYNSSILRGQERVFIIWTRVIRPDGIDIMVGSPGVDSLGRAGFAGFVDEKIAEAYSGAILSSLVTLGIAYGGEKLVGEDKSQQTQTTDPDGNTTTTTPSSPTTEALNQGIANVGSVTQNVVDEMLDMRPTITVDQGTRINVFVNKDLIFPPSVLSQIRILQ